VSIPSISINESEDLESDTFVVSARALTQPKKMIMTLTSAGWLLVVGTKPLSFSTMIDAILAAI
jgi:hypothetical protein